MTSGTLARSSTDKMLGGVCGGLAKYLGIDAPIVRIVAALIVIFTGFGPLVYLVMWALLPDDSGKTGIDQLKGKPAPHQPTDPYADPNPGDYR